MHGHRQTQVNFETAEALAADLAGAAVDVNEAQKVLAYVRNKKEKESLFRYLNTVVKDRHIVIRSGRTMDYYRNLKSACERHLDGMEYNELLQTFGWSLRLLRYYQAAPRRTVRSSPPSSQPDKKLPAKGEEFTGKVLRADESAVLVHVPGFDENTAIALLKVEADMPTYQPNNSARVRVIGVKETGNRTILEVERAEKKKKKKR